MAHRTIQAPAWKPPKWSPGDVDASLEELCKYAEGYADASITWYYEKKKWKARLSRLLRLGTILATALGGLMPVVSWAVNRAGGTATEQALASLRMNQYGYLSLGLAALFLALDRFSGSSTAWMRYIATAASIETARELFRFDWAKLTAAGGGKTPSGSELQALVVRVTEFGSTVRGLIESETKAWVSEFQSNLSELEKRTEAAVNAAREQTRKAGEESESRRSAEAPGAIDLTVANAAETDAGYTVHLDNRAQKEHVAGATCALMGVSPGLHEVALSASIGGVPASSSQVVTVRAGEAVKISLALSKTKAAVK